MAKTASGNKPTSSITNAIRSKPNEIPTPDMFFNPKIPVKSSYRPPPPIEPMATPFGAATSKMAPV